MAAQRRAEEFAALVDGETGTQDAARRNADLLEVVGAMRSVEAPTPRPEFVASLREQLLVEAETALSETGRKLVIEKRTPQRRDRRIAVLAGAVVAIGATSSVAVASQGALPGDTLYPIKRAIEGAQTTLTINDGAKANALMKNADGRLGEIEKMAGRLDSSNTAPFSSTLNDFSEDASRAAELSFANFAESGDTAQLAELREFATSSMARLSALESLLPSSAVDALNNAVLTLVGIDSRVASACPECEGELLDIPLRLLKGMSGFQTAPQALPSTESDGPSAAPTQEPTESAEPDQPMQPVGNDVIDVDELERLLNQVDPGTPSDSPKPTNRERAEKAAKDLQDALTAGGEALLGKDGLLGPVITPLAPVVEGLLSPVTGLLGGGNNTEDPSGD
ncbi:DUF5667 domain-containing protein [Nocardioides sp. AE5]|uniref:DUF5667 domain-containing protein n=1 Tax=Nocardioides sp. AE5 TaxID=2962573 RepID=UPI0028824193|nr:DUF5667 domain-containing protein [Nocardioides sp. AE5]MDT0200634.1 DUF5667 domain-containing protein [Nocardioides sp. AE5]